MEQVAHRRLARRPRVGASRSAVRARSARLRVRIRAATCLLALLAAGRAVALQGATYRVSLREAGQQGNGRNLRPTLSTDGGRVAFMSLSSDLVSNDTNGTWDVFVREASSGAVWRASVDSSGAGGNATSQYPALSADGTTVAFQGYASNLVPGDTNGFPDIFVHELASGTTSRVSVGPGGSQASGGSASASISGDGRYVAFESTAANLVPGDTNATADVFVHDRQTGLTQRVSVTSSGTQANGYSYAPAISQDGRYVAFVSEATNLVAGDTNGSEDVFLHDLVTGTTIRASVTNSGTQANGFSGACSLSADGRLVAFSSDASNLVPGDTNATTDVFVRDVAAGQTELVTYDSGGGPSNAPSYDPRLSADGQRVAFVSLATDLVPGDTNGVMDAFVRDRTSGQTSRVSRATDGTQANGASNEVAIAGNGSSVAFSSLASNLVPLDLLPAEDVFVKVLSTGQVSLQSVCGPDLGASQDSWRTRVSADGRFVGFDTETPDLVAGDTNGVSDVFVRDRRHGRTERVSLGNNGLEANDWSAFPHLSADGRWVAFDSMASNWATGDGPGSLDVFVRDRWNDTIERASVTTGGGFANDQCFGWDLSADGRFVAFSSRATNLVPGDTNGKEDCFVRDRQAGTTRRVSVASGGVQGDGSSPRAVLSADGRYVAFESTSTNLVPGDTNAATDVFLHDQQTASTERVSLATGGAQAHGGSADPSLSSDARYVAFASIATDLVPNDTNAFADIFVRDRQTGTTTRVSVSSLGVQANGASERPTISGDGRYVAFRSFASNLDSGDMNATVDVFVHDRTTGETLRASRSTGGAQADGDCDWPAISREGRHVVFTSLATTLVPDDTNGVEDAFVHDADPAAPTAFCYGDGSGTPCPCGNAGAFGRGCANEFYASGCRLSAHGEAMLSADSLVFDVTESMPGQPGLFFQGNQAIAGGDGVAFGDGLRCAGGGIRRLQVVAAAATGQASSSVSISIAGGVSAGDLRRYQWWYRDPVPSPCGAGFNLSNGLELVWLP